jgi:hypothetical protein
MATAKKIPLPPPPPVPPPPTHKVVLELSLAEAETLLAITGLIGGCPSESRRAHTDAIGEALQDAGLVKPLVALVDDRMNSIYFEKGGV